MRSLTRIGIWPVVLALTVAAFVAAFSPSFTGIQTAQAVDGDICEVTVGGPNGVLAQGDDPDVGGGSFDGQGNPVYVVSRGVTYGLVFRVEDGYWDNVTVQIDSETGSGRITSQAEIVEVEAFGRRDDDDGQTDQSDTVIDTGPAEFDSDDEVIGHLEFHVAHTLVIPPTLTQVVDVIVPETDEGAPLVYIDHFLDSDGNPVNGIGGWLADVGYAAFGNDDDFDDDTNVCGGENDDGWGFIDFECIESGYFHITVEAPDDTEETGKTLKFFCGGQAERAEIKSQWPGVETQPTNVAPNGFGTSVITVTVWDQNDDRVDGVPVTLLTNNCTLTKEGTSFIAPAGGGTVVEVLSDTDPNPSGGTHADQTFLINNPLEHAAGTAEAVLDCTRPGSTPGVADVRAIIERPGSDIVLNVQVNVVGPTAATGLTLVLTPDDVECGETISATATALDANGKPVSNGTEIFFTTDTSSGVVGGSEGAQGDNKTLDGKATVLIATDPSKPGTHTVIAYVVNNAGTPSAQASDIYTCEGGATAPSVPSPDTGTGSITPPNTGDGGLGSSHAGLLVIAGVIGLSVALVTKFRAARA